MVHMTRLVRRPRDQLGRFVSAPGEAVEQIAVAMAEDHTWVCEIRHGEDPGTFISELWVTWGLPGAEHETHSQGAILAHTYADAVDGANRLFAQAPSIVQTFLGDRRFERPDVIGPSLEDEMFG